MKSIAGKWNGVAQWQPAGMLPYVFFPTVVNMEDGLLIVQISLKKPPCLQQFCGKDRTPCCAAYGIMRKAHKPVVKNVAIP